MSPVFPQATLIDATHQIEGLFGQVTRRPHDFPSDLNEFFGNGPLVLNEHAVADGPRFVCHCSMVSACAI